MRNRHIAVAASLALCNASLALEPEPGSLFLRVLDTGPGLACVLLLPSGDALLYDAGHFNSDNRTLESVTELIPPGSNIALMALSHSDSDHLGAVDEIIDAYDVRTVLRVGQSRTTATWGDADNAINAEEALGVAVDINLQETTFLPGATWSFGKTTVTMVSGFREPPANWHDDGLGEAEERNAVSIVLRVRFAGRSILLAGDAVGRHINDADDALIASERSMVELADVVPIDSDVLVAPHHGADNGCSSAFIHAVSPEFVIFSAGHAFGHPTQAAAERCMAHGVPLNNIFRTDLGDDEGDDASAPEWTHGRIAGNTDPVGDDDIYVLIRPSGEVVVAYRDDGSP